MYQTVKDNIINPKALIARIKQRFSRTVGYFFLLVVLLSLPAIIDTLSFTTLTPNDKTAIRQSVSNDFNIPCQIDQTLTCSTSQTYIIDQGNVQFVVDPTSTYQTDQTNLVIVLQEERIQAFVNRIVIATSSYAASSTDLIQWPGAWQRVDFNVIDDAFWVTVFDGLDELLINYAALWKSSFVISLILGAMFAFLVDVLLDSVILKFILRTTHSFGSILKIVIHAMTLYVLTLLLLNLFQVPIPTLLQLLLQLQPILYSVIAIRLPKEPPSYV